MYSQDDPDHSFSLPVTVKPNNKKGRCGRKQVSCSECKRSKMKCELVFPCSSCIKKGCGDICPQGTLIPSKSNLHLKLKKEELQDTVRRLQAKSRTLETELRDAYGHISSSPHPLLRDGDMLSGNPQPAFAPQNAGEDEAGDLQDAFGSLAIGDNGQAIYHAASSSAEHLLRSMMPDSSTSTGSRSFVNSVESDSLPKSIANLTNAFPYGVAKCDDDAKQMLLSLLPSQKQASDISNSYFKSGSSTFPPIDESEFKASVLHQIYAKLDSCKQADLHFHKVAVLYIVLAGGTILADDLDEADNEYKARRIEDADRYYRLSQAALAVETLGGKSNSWTIASLLVMMHYLTVADWGGSEMRWSFFDLTVRVAYKIGLHLDPSHWGLDDSESQRRRDLFWELFVWEYWVSIAYGRPPMINPRFTDCRFERDMEPGIDEDGEIELGFRAYLHRMAAFYLSPLSTFMFNARPPSYPALLKLEEDFRNFKCPSQLQCPTSGLGEPVNGIEWARSAGRAFQQYDACVYFKECTLLYVHRKYMVRALKANSQDPLQTIYGTSVISSIKSATILLGTLRSLLGKHLARASRVAFFWTSALSSIFMLGSLVYVCPGCSIAKQALQAFEDGVDMFINFRSKEDKTGVITTEILLSLRNEVRRLLIEGFSSESRVEACQAVIRMLEGKSGPINKTSLKANQAVPAHATTYAHSPELSMKPELQMPEHSASHNSNSGHNSTYDVLDDYDGNPTLPFSTRDGHGEYKAGFSDATPRVNPTGVLPQMSEYGTDYNPDSGYDSTYDALDGYDGNPALPFFTGNTHGKYMADTTPHVNPTGLPAISERNWYAEADATFDVHASIQGPLASHPGPRSSSMLEQSTHPSPGGIGAGANTPWDLFLRGFSMGRPSSSQSTSSP